MIEEPHYVWSGRFQPFHNGHLFALERILTLPDRRALVIGVLVFTPVDGEPRGPGDIRQGSANNPISGFHRRRMIEEVVTSLHAQARVVVTCLPRTDIYWDIARDMIPPNRTLCFTRRGHSDDFESAKVDRYRALGEDTIMVDVSDGPHISGSLVRAAASSRKDTRSLVPPPVHKYLTTRGLDLISGPGYTQNGET